MLLLLISAAAYAQDVNKLSRTDTIRGSITPEREWWDVLRYEISVSPDFRAKSIQGTVDMSFKVVKAGNRMQIDLQEPMLVEQLTWQGQQQIYTRDGNAYYINFSQMLKEGAEHTITISFSGRPREAVNPPWDGGWIWTKDKRGRPWMSVACQGLGASVWYPCKDHQGDEPDNGAIMNVTVPDSLVAVSNGKLMGTKSESQGKKTYTWAVSNPINTYNLVPYIGYYATWRETYQGKEGNLNCDYWVLDYEVESAKKQFGQVPEMLSCFEHWLGPYPFYEDGFKIVQAPHLGMEHQSAIAYGNGFQNGYLGHDLSQTGWGLKWDYILVHESGHEWFGNNITTHDIADMWVHEGFTSYTECIFTTCKYGVEAGNDYIIGTRNRIGNDTPIIGPYGVNQEGSGDMYFKGANVIHMIRQIINDDEKFRLLLHGLNKTFWHKIVTTRQVEEYISKTSGIDFSKVFDQFLRTAQIPVFEYRIKDKKFYYRWSNCIDGFAMPLKIEFNGKQHWVHPTGDWQPLKEKGTAAQVKVNPNFYVVSVKIEK